MSTVALQVWDQSDGMLDTWIVYLRFGVLFLNGVNLGMYSVLRRFHG